MPRHRTTQLRADMAVRGITVREVARRTGLSEAQVSRIRWNRLVNGPDPAQLAAIEAVVYGDQKRAAS